jgi:hypothetical protein
LAPFRKCQRKVFGDGITNSGEEVSHTRKEDTIDLLGMHVSDGAGKSNSEELGRTKKQDNMDLRRKTIRQRMPTASPASNDSLGAEGGVVKSGNLQPASSISAPHLVLASLLVAVWLPVAMVLNDGVALAAVLLALQISLTVSGLYHSQELTWPAVVLWALTSSQFFFAFGHHATVTSLRFEAGFVGLRGEMSGVNLLCAGLLVWLNMLGSHLLLSLGLLPLLPLSMSVRPNKETPTTSGKLLLNIALQYILFHSFKTLVTLLTGSLQRRHLMVWGVFSPRLLYEAAFLATCHASVILSLLLTSSLLAPSPTSRDRTLSPSP